jgi:hypothetical protein
MRSVHPFALLILPTGDWQVRFRRSELEWLGAATEIVARRFSLGHPLFPFLCGSRYRLRSALSYTPAALYGLDAFLMIAFAVSWVVSDCLDRRVERRCWTDSARGSTLKKLKRLLASVTPAPRISGLQVAQTISPLSSCCTPLLTLHSIRQPIEH